MYLDNNYSKTDKNRGYIRKGGDIGLLLLSSKVL